MPFIIYHFNTDHYWNVTSLGSIAIPNPAVGIKLLYNVVVTSLNVLHNTDFYDS